MTSVWIALASTLLYSPWFSQNRAVSVSSGSMMTSHLSLVRPDRTFALSGAAIMMLRPWQNRPFIWPAAIMSTIFSTS